MKRTLAMAGAGVLLTVAVYEASKLLQYGEPVTYIDVHAVKGEIAPGEPLLLSYYFRRNRVCQCTLDRSVTSLKEPLIVWRNTVPCRLTQPGDISVQNTIPLPELPRGHYQFDTTAYSACHDGVYAAIHGPVPFTIR